MCYFCVTANRLVRGPRAGGRPVRDAGPVRRPLCCTVPDPGPGMLMKSTILVYYRGCFVNDRSTSTFAELPSAGRSHTVGGARIVHALATAVGDCRRPG